MAATETADILYSISLSLSLGKAEIEWGIYREGVKESVWVSANTQKEKIKIRTCLSGL